MMLALTRSQPARWCSLAGVLLVALAGCGSMPVASSATIPPATATVVPSPTALALSPRPATSPQAPTAQPLPSTPPLPTATPYPPAATVAPSPTSLTRSQRQQIFEEVWQLVHQNYLYLNTLGAEWQALHDTYAPLVAESTSDSAFYSLMIELIAQLNDQHSRFVPPAAVVSEDAFASGRESYAGIGVVVLPGREGGFIQMVFPDSPAANADLRPRDRIIAVDDRPYLPDDGDLRGLPGSRVRLNIVRPGSKPRDVVLTREEISGRVAPYYRRFPGEVGYVWISTLWANDMDEQVSGALTELIAAGPLEGLIIDLRGNGGGWEHVLAGILNHFARGQVGVFYNRIATRPLVLSSPAGPDLRGLPLAVLIDQDTASYAEVLAAILQHEAQAHVVGVPSSGNTETIYAHALADGSRLWLAQEGFRLQDGIGLEGHGVQPDATVDVDWKRYSEEDDPQLLEALRLLGAGPK